MAKGRKVNAKGRNDTEQYVKLSYRMLRSPAWRSLGGPAMKAYFELRTRFNGSNNGELTLSLDEAARLLHMSKTTAKRALVEIEEKGFVVMTKRGNGTGAKRPSSRSPTSRSTANYHRMLGRIGSLKKQILGTLTAPLPPPTGPSRYRRMRDGAVSVPVRAIWRGEYVPSRYRY